MRGMLLFCIAFTAAPLGMAAPPEARIRKRPTPLWYKYRLDLTWVNAGTKSFVSPDPLNPGNAVLRLPHLQGLSELRPDLKVETRELHLIARPRFRYLPSQTLVKGERINSYDQTKLVWNEANIQWTPSDFFGAAYGLQNFQWGPAEAISPSNRIFHETGQSRTVLYEPRGKHLLRLNFSAGKDWSGILLAELTNNGEPSFVAEQSFEQKALAKLEYNWNSGVNYIGLVFGARQRNGSWLGEYANYSVTDALSVYFDASHEIGSEAWYPEVSTEPGTNQGRVVFAQSYASQRAIYHLTASGLRYSFENGSDVRLEYIYNSAGYQDSDYKLVKKAAQSNDSVQRMLNMRNLSRLINSGLEFPGLSFLYLSARIPDFLAIRDLVLYNRYLHSLGDQSGSAYLGTEYALGTFGTVFFAGAMNFGGPESELGSFLDGMMIMGYRHVW